MVRDHLNRSKQVKEKKDLECDLRGKMIQLFKLPCHTMSIWCKTCKEKNLLWRFRGPELLSLTTCHFYYPTIRKDLSHPGRLAHHADLKTYDFIANCMFHEFWVICLIFQHLLFILYSFKYQVIVPYTILL